MTDDRAAAGIDHLQAAALEMIQAARAFLDVAEEFVADRDKVADLVAVVGTMAEAAGRAARPGHGSSGRDASGHGGADHDGGGSGAAPDDGHRVQHIRVS